MQTRNTEIKDFLIGVINSYGQIFFSTKYWFSFLLLLVSFFDPYAGLAGLLSIVTANSVAHVFGYNKSAIYSGLYGFNALLVGLGLGVYFELSIALLFIVIISAILTLFISIMLEGILYKYGLPFLSIPFLFVIWILNLSAGDFTALGLSQRGLYTINSLYANGGENLVSIYQWWSNLVNYNILTTYFISLGAIFFQYNVLAGIIISIGILIFSRIAFTLSLIGYFSAYFFYILIGSDISNVSYMYIGFNYILTAIALGGFFIIPSKTSYFWTVLLIPLVAMLTISLNSVFTIFGISIYSLPFNIIVLLFIYVLKLRNIKKTNLKTVTVQEYSPEKNLYSYLNYKTRLSNLQENISIQLPFYGEWTVSQGHSGDITHQGEWKHAWDFIIKQGENQNKGAGAVVSDYYCYSKAVLAPADGVIEEIVDGIEDNVIGEINIEQNWGNTIIIRHHNKLFTKLSHLKKGSYKVSVGDVVKSGQELASCGSSGRSPVPHLHFQIQETPFIGSKTIEYPIASYFLENNKLAELKSFAIPEENDILKRPIPDKLMQNAFKWTAGKTFKWIDNSTQEKIKWEVKINYLNETYIECKHTKAIAFFTATDEIFFFTGFKGTKSSALYLFYLSSQKVNMSFFENMKYSELIRPNDIYKGINMILQDFAAPFYIWMKPLYRITYKSSKVGFTKQNITINSQICKANKTIVHKAEIVIGEKGIEKIKFNNTELSIDK